MNYKNPNLFPNRSLLKILDDYYVAPRNGRHCTVPEQYRIYAPQNESSVPESLTGLFNPNVANKIKLFMNERFDDDQEQMYYPVKYDQHVVNNFQMKKDSNTYQYPQYGVPRNCPPMTLNQLTKAWWTHGLY